jgi:hypothetical protein
VRVRDVPVVESGCLPSPQPFQAEMNNGRGGKNRHTRVYQGIVTFKAQNEERRATRRARKFHRRIPMGSDGHRTNSIDIQDIPRIETESSDDRHILNDGRA